MGMKKKLKPLIEKAFAHHDSDDDGVLDEEEASEFFEHFVERFVEFQCKTGLKAADKAVAMQANMMQGFGQMMGGDKNMMSAMKKQMDNELAAGKKKLREARKEKLDNYADKRE